MPSFLSKVFGRKKDDKDTSPRAARPSESLLEGKFEEVSPTVSPSATKFPEIAANGKSNGHGNGKDKEKDSGFSNLFKSKSRAASTDRPQKNSDQLTLPLSLNFSEAGQADASSRALGVVFDADPDAQILLTDAVIGERRLSPAETLTLVRACSQAITARGLETLGIMHPHWHSASPDIQRRLISLFIHSLSSTKNTATTLLPSSPVSSASIFESEISVTRSPHDVAAVLRWGLRHLKLDGTAFGNEVGWYKNFFEAERQSQYPPKAFTEQLSRQVPAAHLELLVATLEIFSSLAAHAETNSTSGSKLSKLFGLWLLTTQRAEGKDDWLSFYTRWERTGRMLEHLFLSRIREESTNKRMPTRLLELVHHYPYTKSISSPTLDINLLPRPQFSTRQYDALFVRIETPTTESSSHPRHHPLLLVVDAFNSTVGETGEHQALWDKIKQAYLDESSSPAGSSPGLSRVFANETIRFLSLIPLESSDTEPSSPTFNIYNSNGKPPQSAISRRRSVSLGDRDRIAFKSSLSGHTKPATDASPLSPPSAFTADWAQFSTSGFLETSAPLSPLASTLLDKDVERSQPPSRKSSKRTKGSATSPTRGRKSLDSPRSTANTEQATGKKLAVKSTMVQIIQLDEAFIDFWGDALLDPISSNWPEFAICKLKVPSSSSPSSSTFPDLKVGDKRLEWLVIEHTYRAPAPPSPKPAPVAAQPRSVSPKLSFVSESRKRFSFFSGSASRAQSGTSISSTKGKKKEKGVKVGEMGEIVHEEDETPKEKEKKDGAGIVKLGFPSPKRKAPASHPLDEPALKKSDEEQKPEVVAKKDVHSTTVATVGAVAGAVVVGAAVDAGITATPILDSTPAPAEVEVPKTEAPQEDQVVSIPPAPEVSSLDVDAAKPIQVVDEPTIVEVLTPLATPTPDTEPPAPVETVEGNSSPTAELTLPPTAPVTVEEVKEIPESEPEPMAQFTGGESPRSEDVEHVKEDPTIVETHLIDSSPVVEPEIQPEANLPEVETNVQDFSAPPEVSITATAEVLDSEPPSPPEAAVSLPEPIVSHTSVTVAEDQAPAPVIEILEEEHPPAFEASIPDNVTQPDIVRVEDENPAVPPGLPAPSESDEQVASDLEDSTPSELETLTPEIQTAVEEPNAFEGNGSSKNTPESIVEEPAQVAVAASGYPPAATLAEVVPVVEAHIEAEPMIIETHSSDVYLPPSVNEPIFIESQSEAPSEPTASIQPEEIQSGNLISAVSKVATLAQLHDDSNNVELPPIPVVATAPAIEDITQTFVTIPLVEGSDPESLAETDTAARDPVKPSPSSTPGPEIALSTSEITNTIESMDADHEATRTNTPPPDGN